MISGTRWDRLRGRWREFVLWLVRPFTRCGNDKLCPSFADEFAEHDGDNWNIILDGTPVYVYYCPWCGRKVQASSD